MASTIEGEEEAPTSPSFALRPSVGTWILPLPMHTKMEEMSPNVVPPSLGPSSAQTSSVGTSMLPHPMPMEPPRSANIWEFRSFDPRSTSSFPCASPSDSFGLMPSVGTWMSPLSLPKAQDVEASMVGHRCEQGGALLSSPREEVDNFLLENGFIDSTHGSGNTATRDCFMPLRKLMRRATNTQPLHLAVKRNNPEMVGHLVHLGADATCRDCWGRTPLKLARSRNRNGSHNDVIAKLPLDVRP